MQNTLPFTTSEQNILTERGYTMIKKLNQGSYAKVYLAKYKNFAKSPRVTSLACKIIDTQTASRDFVKRFLPRELEMLIKVNHPHIVHTHSIFQRKTKYFIFMRYMELGDVLDYVLHNGAISEDQARIWIRQISLGIQYLHELDIAHRDVKCENCLLSQNLNVKLSDFGFARSCVDDKMRPIFSSTFCGSLSYTAPEILQGLPYAPKPTDIWSMGIVLYVMLNRALPFDDKHIRTLYVAQMGKKWKFKLNAANIISHKCKKLVANMMEPNPLHRIKIDKVITSDWIAMDSRLLVWTDPEIIALKKAEEMKRKEFQRVEFGKTRKNLRLSNESLCGSRTLISDMRREKPDERHVEELLGLVIVKKYKSSQTDIV